MVPLNVLKTDTEMPGLKQPTVLIISDDAAFSSAITGRWPAEPNRPSFTLMSSDLCREMDSSAFDLAIVGDIGSSSRTPVERSLAAAKKPAILVLNKEEKAKTGPGPWIKVLRKDRQESSGWLDALILLSSETLLHAQAAAALRKMEQQNALLSRNAALGDYMLDMRHNLNNALTSILGNSELLLLDGHLLTDGIRAQVETIRNMSIRIHEILQRFSSLEKELAVGEEQARPNSRAKGRAFIAGA